MPKSVYPSAIDSSVQLPTVRGNITELSPSIINDLKSAVIQIERTLGVNPNGVAGLTLADRLNNLIDANGNLLPSAINNANLIGGKIIDSDLSVSAGISENKLNLIFPTPILQSQISEARAIVDVLNAQLNSISLDYANHLTPDLPAAHTGKSVLITSKVKTTSPISSNSVISSDLQAAIELVYSSHINYDGTSISSQNLSHSAKQLFFDKTNSASISSNSVQGAIEELGNIGLNGVVSSTRRLASNGIVRENPVVDGFSGTNLGAEKIPLSAASYNIVEGQSYQTITLSTPIIPSSDVQRFDIVTITGSSYALDNKSYKINSVTLTPSLEISSISVFDGPRKNTIDPTFITISAQTLKPFNINSLNCTVRPRPNATNTPDVTIANPNSATIIGTAISTEKISPTASTFSISIDGGSFLDIDVFDPSVTVQTERTVAEMINSYAVLNKLLISAYVVRLNNCYAIAISHLLPNSVLGYKKRTLSIAQGSVNNGLTEIGLYVINDVIGDSGTGVHLNGVVQSSFEPIATLANSDISLNLSTNSMTLTGSTASELGIRNGDTLIIEGSSNSLDDGAYRVLSISSVNITLDSNGYLFLGSLSTSSKVFVIRNSATIGELSFTESISANGSILFDVFVDNNYDFNFSKRIEIDGEINSPQVVIGITDVSRNFIRFGEVYTLSVDTLGFAYISDFNLISGKKVKLSKSGKYRLFSSDNLSFIEIYAKVTSLPLSLLSVTLHGSNEIPLDSILLSRGLFGTSLGRILGEGAGLGVPLLIDKRITGTIGVKDLSKDIIETYIEGPRNELRSSGVISGVNVSNLINLGSGRYSVDISGGVYYSNGIRVEYEGLNSFEFIANNNSYLVLSSDGCVISGEEILSTTLGGATAVSPFIDSYFSNISYIDITNLLILDTKFDISNLDFKVGGNILVSSNLHAGHFSDLSSAVDYARLYSSLFPNSSNPSIKILSGEYVISKPIILDFDVEILGSGRGTILTRSPAFGIGSIGTPPVSGNNLVPDLSQSVFLIGLTPASSSSRIMYGVSIGNLTYKTSSSILGVSSFISITQGISTSESPNALFGIHDINFIGPSTMSYSLSSPIGDYLLTVGKQVLNSKTALAGSENGNILLTGCRMNYSGVELGAASLLWGSGNIYRNIIATNNISENTRPIITFDTPQIFSQPIAGIATITGMIESANSVTY